MLRIFLKYFTISLLLSKNNLLASLPAAPLPAQQAHMLRTVEDGAVFIEDR